jgi:hypothetical protein
MSKTAAYRRLALKAFFDFSGAIAIPAVLAAFVGQWLDERYATGQRYLFVSLAVAFLLTSVIIVKKAKKYGAAYEHLTSNETKEEDR